MQDLTPEVPDPEVPQDHGLVFGGNATRRERGREQNSAAENRLVVIHLRRMPSRSREFRKRQEQQASWDRLRNAPWSPFASPGAFASGLRRIQLVRLPSFSPPTFWEVCELGSEWLLYSATVVNPDPHALTVQGYERVEFEGGKLKAYYERLTSLTLPIAPDLSNTGALDGTGTQLALFGGLSSEVRFQWWSEYPPGWARLVEIADEMFAAFGGPAAGE